MGLESKNVTKKNHHTVSASNKRLFQQKSEKIGLLKKFLTWIAKGADELNNGRTFCPT